MNPRVERRDPVTRWTPFEALPEYLSPQEFAIYIGLSRATVYEMITRGDLPHVRLGRRFIRIPKAVLATT